MWTILKAIPNLLALIVELIKAIKTAMRLNPEQFVEDSHEAIDQLKKAKTVEEKQDAARALSKLIGRL